MDSGSPALKRSTFTANGRRWSSTTIRRGYEEARMTTLFAPASGNIPRSDKRRICFPVTSRAYYGRSQLLLRRLHAHPRLELELMLGGSILLDKYSRHIADDIEASGFAISTSLFNVIEGGNHVAMAKTACLTALEFTNAIHTLSPDVVVICGDR